MARNAHTLTCNKQECHSAFSQTTWLPPEQGQRQTPAQAAPLHLGTPRGGVGLETREREASLRSQGSSRHVHGQQRLCLQGLAVPAPNMGPLRGADWGWLGSPPSSVPYWRQLGEAADSFKPPAHRMAGEVSPHRSVCNCTGDRCLQSCLGRKVLEYSP